MQGQSALGGGPRGDSTPEGQLLQGSRGQEAEGEGGNEDRVSICESSGGLQGSPKPGFPQRQVGIQRARPNGAGTNSSGLGGASSHPPAGLPAGEA